MIIGYQVAGFIQFRESSLLCMEVLSVWSLAQRISINEDSVLSPSLTLSFCIYGVFCFFQVVDTSSSQIHRLFRLYFSEKSNFSFWGNFLLYWWLSARNIVLLFIYVQETLNFQIADVLLQAFPSLQAKYSAENFFASTNAYKRYIISRVLHRLPRWRDMFSAQWQLSHFSPQ